MNTAAIEHVLKVFAPHLESHTYLEVVRSPRHGFVLLKWDETEGDYADASLIRSAEDLTEELLQDVAAFYLMEKGKDPDPEVMDEEDRKAIQALQESFRKAL